MNNLLTNEEIISNHQLGFRSLHSTVTALLEATDNWAFNIDRGNVNAVVLLDLKKTFDTVDHDILLSKTNLYRIQGTALDWFKSYLTSCQPRMYADDTHITFAGVDVNSIQLNLNHDLENLNKWLISNNLTLNTAKTEFMLLGSRQKLSTL